jgi:hypothetical protein
MRNWDEIERRRATRHLFGGAAEVINLESQMEITSLARDLSPTVALFEARILSPKGQESD